MSRIYFLVVFVVLADCLFAQQDTLQLSGTYDGRALYFQNPETDEEGIFSTISFWINGMPYPDDSLNQSAYRIIPASVGIQKGGSLTIQIVYHSGYRPRLISPQGPPVNPIKVSDLFVDSTGHICWNISGLAEIDSMICFQVQRYYWNKWNNEGTVCLTDGDGQYCHDVMEMDGKNDLRIISTDSTYRFISTTLSFYSDRPKMNYSFNKRSKKIEFESYTLFELYNEKGDLLLNDYQQVVDLSGFPKGKYYFNYWNTSDIIRLK